MPSTGVLVIIYSLALTGELRGAPGDVDSYFNATLEVGDEVFSIIPEPGGGVVTLGRDGSKLVHFQPDGRRDEAYGASLPLGFGLQPVTSGLSGQLVGFWKPTGANVGTVVRLNAAGAIDDSFRVELLPGEIVNSLDVQMDGRVLVWSSYTTTLSNVHWERIRRFNPDGTLDESFAEVKPLSLCAAILELGDGKVVLTGAVGIGDLGERGIVRLHADGRLDTSFGMGGGVGQGCVGRAIPVIASGLVAITDYGTFGEPTLALTKFFPDGSRDFEFQPSAINGRVDFVAEQALGKLLITGNFQNVQGSSRKLVARLNRDGSLDTGYVPGIAASRIEAAALSAAGQLLIAGNGMNSKAFFVRLEGSEWPVAPPTIVSQTQSQVKKVGEDASFEVVVRATPAPAYQWSFNGRTMDGETNSYLTVRNLRYSHTGSYMLQAASGWSSVTSEPVHLLVNPPVSNAGSVDLAFDPGQGVSSVRAIQMQGDKIVIGGSFTKYNGITVSNIARLNSDGGLDETFQSTGANAFVHRLAIDADKRIYAGGAFSTFNGSPRNLLVRLSPDGIIDEFFVPPDWQTVPRGRVSALSLENGGKVLVAGNLNGMECVVRLNSDGTLDETWSVQALDLRLFVIASQNDGSVLVGGAVSATNPAARLLRLGSNGKIDTSYPSVSAPQAITHLLPLDDGRVVVGFSGPVQFPPFTLVSYVALTPDGAVDTTFPPSKVMFGVTAFLRLDAHSFLLAGGAMFLGRCGTNGVIETTFRPQFDQTISAMALQPDGNILIAGSFTRVSNVTRRGMARLFATEQSPEPLILGPFVSQGGFEFSIPTTANHVFTLEFKETIDHPAWQSAVSISGNGQWQSLKDPAPSGTQRFYRIRVD